MALGLALILAILIGYLVGAIPSGVIVSRALAGRDPRHVGSGHTGGLNTARTIGAVGFFLAGVPDAMKGIAALVLVRQFVTADPWASAAAGVAAVAGHCWPVYIGFSGGMGISVLGGLMLFLSPLVVPVVIALWAVLRFTVIRHTPRAVAFAALATGPAAWLFGALPPVIALGAAGGLVLFLRHLSDWRRVYGPAMQNTEGR
jgi:glycerol-3-phosphate acyltransferase PlsY